MRLIRIFIFSLLFVHISENIIASPSNYSANDSLMLAKWGEGIRSRLFNDPASVLSSIDSLQRYSDSTENLFGQYLEHNLKGTYYWSKWEYDSSLIQYKEALTYAMKGNIKRSISGSFGNIALVFMNMQNFDSSVYYYDKTIRYARENQLDESLVRNLVNLNSLFIRKGNYVESVKLLYEAKEISQRLQNHTLLTMVYSGFADLYHSIGNFEMTRRFFLLTLHEDSLETEFQASPSIYLNLGEAYWRMKNDADSSRYYFGLALTAAQGSQKAELQHAIQNNIGNILFREKKIDSAIYYYLTAFNQPYTEYLPNRKASLLVNLGNSYLEKKEYTKAKEYLISGYALSDSLNLMQYQLNALYGLIRLDSMFGNFSSAFERSKVYNKLQDSMDVDHAKNQIAELEIERILEKEKLTNQLLLDDNVLKEQMIQEQYEQKIVYIILLIASVVFTIVQIINIKKIRRLNRKLLEQNDEVLALNNVLLENNEQLNSQQIDLKELNKTKDKFFSILSHDLKSPFSSVVAMLELISSDWPLLSDQEKQNIIKQLHKSALSTYELLEDLLSWSKSQQGLIKYQAITFDLIKLLDEIKQLINPAIENKSIRLMISVDQDVKLETDYRLLFQVVQNFAINAIKYTHENGTVTISAKAKNDQVCISVSDTGIGIPQEKLTKIFELDCDFSRPGTNNEKSSGMGLILCKEYARILNAEITATSEIEKGSVFSIFIPKNN